jgi:hypothetical protein
MTPPELTRDTPILNVLQPSKPVGFGLLRGYMELASPRALESVLMSSLVDVMKKGPL